MVRIGGGVYPDHIQEKNYLSDKVGVLLLINAPTGLAALSGGTQCWSSMLPAGQQGFLATRGFKQP